MSGGERAATREAGDAAREAARQRALLAALAMPESCPADLVLADSADRASRGLAVYRANAAASADRALATAFGTVRAMVGDDDFRRLAREFWQAHPPQRGDLGEWGDTFPAWLGAHIGLRPWPWLSDCAALDLVLHRCERAADAELDAASLALLATHDPARLHIRTMPCLGVLRSAWPIATIHRAHHAHADAAGDALDPFSAVQSALAERRGETVAVARRGWRGVVHGIDEPTAVWMQALARGLNLAEALDLAGAGFDFSAWLTLALRENWLNDVCAAAD